MGGGEQGVGGQCEGLQAVRRGEREVGGKREELNTVGKGSRQWEGSGRG